MNDAVKLMDINACETVTVSFCNNLMTVTKTVKDKDCVGTMQLGDAVNDITVERCYTCKYWQGDKAKVIADIDENPLCMDLFKGWAEIGVCGIDYEWKELVIDGDASVALKVPANFGCPYWGKD